MAGAGSRLFISGGMPSPQEAQKLALLSPAALVRAAGPAARDRSRDPSAPEDKPRVLRVLADPRPA